MLVQNMYLKYNKWHAKKPGVKRYVNLNSITTKGELADIRKKISKSLETSKV